MTKISGIIFLGIKGVDMKRQGFERTPFFPGMEPEAKLLHPTKDEESDSSGTLEIVHCQYCEDVGACTFCERGQKEMPYQKRWRN
ncbi:MAG: hypothetical protein M1275_02635 [Patescibacteria group bacterium]|nr:hypothetical protein [Patescibacteria group bacterium]